MFAAIRKRRLSSVVLGVGCSLLVSTCGKPPSNLNQTLVIGQVAEPRSLDPHITTTTNDFRILNHIYEGLVRFKSGTLELEPGLAKSWQTSADGKTYTFQLRPDIQFHDGSPLNAEAIAFNFNRMLDETHPYYDTGPFPLAFFFSVIEKVSVLNNLTVQFQLKEPYGPFLSNLAYPTGFILSPAAVQKWGKEVGRYPSGTGPFQFSAWDSHWKVTLVANEHYWQVSPKLKQLIFQPITDLNARSAEMLAGNLDLMVEPPIELTSVFQKHPELEVEAQLGAHLWFMILNAKTEPFRDRKVRQAVNYAINKQAILNGILQNTAEAAAGPIPKAFSWAVNPKLQPYPYDPERAKALLQESNYDGSPLTLLVPESGSGMLSPVQMATAMQADLQAVGMPVKIQTYEWNSYLSVVNQGLSDQAHMAAMAWMVNDPDTLPYLTLRRAAWPDEGGFNSGYYANEKLDQLLEKARRSSNQTERAQLYQQIESLVHQDAPWLFMASAKQMVVRRKTVQNFQLEPSFLLTLDQVIKQPGPVSQRRVP